MTIRTAAVGANPEAAEASANQTAANIGFGSFYNHFDSKDELFATASTEVIKRWARVRVTGGW
ncbi:MAG: hypothetical protein ACLPKI_27815 [Streptosporangiaceae bacterium]